MSTPQIACYMCRKLKPGPGVYLRRWPHGYRVCLECANSCNGAAVVVQHIRECTDAKAAIVVDGSADDLVARLAAEGWSLDERVDLIAGKRIRFLTKGSD